MRTPRRTWADHVGNLISVLGLACIAALLIWMAAIGVAALVALL